MRFVRLWSGEAQPREEALHLTHTYLKFSFLERSVNVGWGGLRSASAAAAADAWSVCVGGGMRGRESRKGMGRLKAIRCLAGTPRDHAHAHTGPCCSFASVDGALLQDRCEYGE